MTLEQALAQSVGAEASYDGYTTCISESDVSGYGFTIQKGAMPPHVTRHFDTLGECLQEWSQGDANFIAQHEQDWHSFEEE